jgi:hypothetical protein
MKDMKVFYNGCELLQDSTLDEQSIDTDCILHAVDNVRTDLVVNASVGLHQWKQLLYLKPPARNKVAENVLIRRSLSVGLSGRQGPLFPAPPPEGG